MRFPISHSQNGRGSLSSNIKHLIGAKMEKPHSSSSSSSQYLLETLTTRGWCFRDVNEVNSLIAGQSSSSSYTVDSIESELVNMDLRSIGGKSLPDFSTLRKASHFQGPKILQVIIPFQFSLCIFVA